ncbi:MAG: pitrilysin family protein [Pseudomonadota bacterium]
MRFLLIALIALAWPAAATTALDRAIVSQLPNGMDVIVLEDRRAPVVVHMVWYKVGAADEVPGKSGIAHFLEHLLFKGTDTVPGDEFQRLIEANGGQDNAFTSHDYTAYFQRIAADRLDLVMRLEADRMRNLVLSPEIVALERLVVLEERNTRVDASPGGVFAEQRAAVTHVNHPYGRPIIGWRHEIEALSYTDALDFYRRYYAPNNAVLIVAGDVDPAEVFQLAERHYAPLARSEDLPPRVRPQDPVALAERRLVYRDARVTDPVVTRSYPAPHRRPGDQAEAAAAFMLAELLGGTRTAHLPEVLEIDEQVALSAGASFSATSHDPRRFSIFAVAAPGVQAAKLEARLDTALADFLETGPTQADLARVKARVRAAQIYALDGLDGRARRYGVALASGLTVGDVQDWPAVLQAVTLADIRAVAARIFDRNQAVTGYMLGPEDAQ